VIYHYHQAADVPVPELEGGHGKFASQAAADQIHD